MTTAWLQTTGTPYVRRADLASDNLDQWFFSLDDEIYIGAYCLDRPISSPTGGAVADEFIFDECATSRIDYLREGF